MTVTGNNAITVVTAQWNVPTPNPIAKDGSSSYSSSWIGIDGYGSDDVFQAGVECDALSGQNGTQRDIYVWWEWFPENEVGVDNFAVAAGDQLWCALIVN